MKMALAVLASLVIASVLNAAEGGSGPAWHFVVAGDSRNCGDVVMPAIAEQVRATGAAFYWHLGDLRAIYTFDDDMTQEATLAGKTWVISDYERAAWPDAARNQLMPFDPIPFYLAIGNHETIPPKTRAEFVAQFADWLNQPVLQRQRLLDDPADHMLKTYFHWQVRGIEFISLDNASADMFDSAQVAWFEKVLGNDAKDDGIRAVVLGMHGALPHSIGCDHSMDESGQGERSGTRVYKDLLQFRSTTQKAVYVLASHSHFVMSNVYDSDYWRANGGVLPGWIVGTSGAIRYRLPDAAARVPLAKTDVYGFLDVTVNPPGSPEAITFQFKELARTDVPPAVITKYTSTFIDQCFDGNRDMHPAKAVTCADVVPCIPPGP
jgi:hypothetical protein